METRKKKLSDKKFPKINLEEDKNDEILPQLYPDVYEVSRLKIDNRLPMLKFVSFKDSISTDKETIDLLVELAEIRNADIYLYLNDEKKDMYYQADPGKFKFKNIPLLKGENKVEFFYRSGERRSQSAVTIINRK